VRESLRDSADGKLGDDKARKADWDSRPVMPLSEADKRKKNRLEMASLATDSVKKVRICFRCFSHFCDD